MRKAGVLYDNAGFSWAGRVTSVTLIDGKGNCGGGILPVPKRTPARRKELHMTTITTEVQAAQPTTRTGASAGLAARTWRYVAVFAAGAALSVAVAAGISAATDNHTPVPTRPATASTSATHASANDQCPLQVARPC